jgi:hypothetical protein
LLPAPPTPRGRSNGHETINHQPSTIILRMALRLIAELGGDGSGFDAMMNRAHGRVRQFGSQAIAPLKNLIAGAFTVGAITSLSRKTIEYASHIRDVSDALRVNVEWFQKRANAAKLAGGSEEDLFKFLDEMNKQRAAAVQDPGGEMAQRFGRLGFSQDDVSGLNTMAFFDKIVAAFGDGASAQTAVDVEKVGGRSARMLLAAFANQFQSDMPVMSEQLINQLDDIGDEFTRLGNFLVINFAPAVIAAANAIAQAANLVAQSAAGAGGFAPTFQGKMEEANKNATGSPWARWWKLMKTIPEATSAGWEQFQHEVVSLEADQLDLADQLEMARIKARELRKKREQSAPDFQPLEDLGPEKAGKPRPLAGPASDALVSVGNFLGRNTDLINDVAAQQLQIAKQQLDVQRQLLAAFQTRQGLGQSLEVPFS